MGGEGNCPGELEVKFELQSEKWAGVKSTQWGFDGSQVEELCLTVNRILNQDFQSERELTQTWV